MVPWSCMTYNYTSVTCGGVGRDEKRREEEQARPGTSGSGRLGTHTASLFPVTLCLAPFSSYPVPEPRWPTTYYHITGKVSHTAHKTQLKGQTHTVFHLRRSLAFAAPPLGYNIKCAFFYTVFILLFSIRPGSYCC